MKAFMRGAAVCLSLGWASSTAAIDLDGTLFDKAGKQYGIDPKLVYAVALAESASGRGNGAISPWPWTLRSKDAPVYALNRADAEAALEQLQLRYGKRLDVGLMQINLYWHGQRVDSPALLLDPETNVMNGTAILAEVMRSAPHDPELGIGRYHHWKNEELARNYGSRVLAIYKNLKDLEGRGHVRY